MVNPYQHEKKYGIPNIARSMLPKFGNGSNTIPGNTTEFNEFFFGLVSFGDRVQWIFFQTIICAPNRTHRVFFRQIYRNYRKTQREIMSFSFRNNALETTPRPFSTNNVWKRNIWKQILAKQCRKKNVSDNIFWFVFVFWFFLVWQTQSLNCPLCFHNGDIISTVWAAGHKT